MPDPKSGNGKRASPLPTLQCPPDRGLRGAAGITFLLHPGCCRSAADGPVLPSLPINDARIRGAVGLHLIRLGRSTIVQSRAPASIVELIPTNLFHRAK